jgi:phosphatidylinositol alpha-1,6-mannosyltransferase
MGPSLLVTSEFPPAATGVARALGQIARHYPAGALVVSTGAVAGAQLGDRRLEVRVDRIGIPVARLKGLPAVLLWSRRVATLAREVQPEFVWCGTVRPAAYPAKWLRERLGLPFGILLHGPDVLGWQHRLHQSRVRRGAVRSLLGSASVIVANSHWTRERCEVLSRELGLEPAADWIRVVPLGTDPEQFRPGLPTGEMARHHRLAEGRWVLTVASATSAEALAVAVRGFAAVAREVPDLQYAVVWQGPSPLPMVRLAGDLGVADRVRFLAGVAPEDLPAMYNHALAYLAVSRPAGLDVEGFGLAALDASACAVPVVAGRSGGLADLVREGETGVLVDSESVESVAAALRDLLHRPERARALGAGGRHAVETYYHWTRVAADLQTISAELRRAPLPATRS